jgi:hypothetical protein
MLSTQKAYIMFYQKVKISKNQNRATMPDSPNKSSESKKMPVVDLFKEKLQ